MPKTFLSIPVGVIFEFKEGDEYFPWDHWMCQGMHCGTSDVKVRLVYADGTEKCIMVCANCHRLRHFGPSDLTDRKRG